MKPGILIVILLLGPALSAQNNPAEQVRTRNTGGVRLCDQFAGTTAGERIAACIADLPSGGGVADARGLEDVQSITSTLTIDKSVRLLLGTAAYTLKSEILVTADYAWIECAATTLRASVKGQSIIHWSGSHGGISGSCMLDGGNLSDVTGLRISPRTETEVAPRTVNSFNNFYNIQILNTAEGIVLRTGPTVMGVQSDASYNAFYGIKILDSVRGVWLTNHPSMPSASPDSNQFYSLLAYSNGTRTNTGIQIDAGSTNGFYGCSTIGMQNGNSPSVIPTAIYIRGRAALSGSDNNSNFFYGQRSENDTRALNITSPGGNHTALIGVAGFTTARTLDNGNQTVLLNAPDQDKGIWHTYSDSTGIPVIGTPYGLELTSTAGVTVTAADSSHNALNIIDSTRAWNGEIGSLTIQNSTNRNRKMILGMDTTIRSGTAFIQSVDSGSNTLPLILNAEGGPVGIGTSLPTSALQVVGIPVYANNAAALAGGLTPGAFYRTGADPDPIMIVH